MIGPYDEDKDYCGACNSWTSKFISRRIFGVDMNIACYDHDCNYEDGGTEEDRKAADKQFLADMRKEIKNQMSWYNPFRPAAYVWALRRYHFVRLFGFKDFNYREKKV